MAEVLKTATVKKLSSTKSLGKYTWNDSVCTLYADSFNYTENGKERRFVFTGQEIHVEVCAEPV